MFCFFVFACKFFSWLNVKGHHQYNLCKQSNSASFRFFFFANTKFRITSAKCLCEIHSCLCQRSYSEILFFMKHHFFPHSFLVLSCLLYRFKDKEDDDDCVIMVMHDVSNFFQNSDYVCPNYSMSTKTITERKRDRMRKER